MPAELRPFSNFFTDPLTDQGNHILKKPFPLENRRLIRWKNNASFTT
jgi:hypothetical protein